MLARRAALAALLLLAGCDGEPTETLPDGRVVRPDAGPIDRPDAAPVRRWRCLSC